MDFELIYKEYFKDVFLYTRSLSADEQIAEEIAQETFFKALKSLDSFDGSKDIKAWLFTIAKNTYYTYCKKQKIYVDVEIENEPQNVQTDIVAELIDKQTAFSVHKFLHNMEEPYKEVFTLRVFGELPFEKIGELFGKSSGWARVVFYRAKIQIKEYMEVFENE